jgi:hypothetical protein
MGNGITKSAENIMFFHGHCTAGFGNAANNGAGIQWFYGMYVDQINADPFFFQDPSRFYGFPHHMATGKNAHILTFGKLLGLTYNKIIRGEWPNRPAKPQVVGRYMRQWLLWLLLSVDNHRARTVIP